MHPLLLNSHYHSNWFKLYDFIFFKEINTFIKQEHIKLIKRDCEAFIMLQKIYDNLDKMYHGFHKNSKQHDCFQH